MEGLPTFTELEELRLLAYRMNVDMLHTLKKKVHVWYEKVFPYVEKNGLAMFHNRPYSQTEYNLALSYENKLDNLSIIILAQFNGGLIMGKLKPARNRRDSFNTEKYKQRKESEDESRR